MKKSAENVDQGFEIVLFTALIVFFIKACFSYHVYGSNDMTYYMMFSRAIEKFGTFKLYSMTHLANHPPLVSWLIALITLVQHKTQLNFSYLFRLMPITADFLSIVMIWELLKKYVVKHRVMICLMCILNPVNFLISGFHGSTDPVFVFLILCALYLIEEGRTTLGGMAYGLSLCIKIAPIILLPAFFYFLKTKKQRTQFFIPALVLPLAVFLPYFINDYHAVLKDVFYYNSLNGIWGIGHILKSVSINAHQHVFLKRIVDGLFKFHIASFKVMFFIIQFILIKFLADKRALNLIELSFLTFCLFLTITPGFGVQYLSWLSLFAIMIFPLLGSMYTLLSGFFLYRVYAYWGGAKAPYYANSKAAGQWHGVEAVLDILLWLLIAAMLTVFIKRTRKTQEVA